jgi:predicted acylesterase/phospholipase RssA
MRLSEFIWNRWQVSEAQATHVAGAIVSGTKNGSTGWGQSPYLILCVAALLLTSFGSAWAEDPCASVKQRALVLGGGGVKGAFEAGAIYHLVAQRHCDFVEFSGVSVGALNATFLAQARRAKDAKDSYANLLDQSEALVSLWQSLKSSGDVARSRPLATLRFGVFGLDSLFDFTPLRRLEDKNIALEKLSAGRPVRVGVLSFYDGEYQEILAQSLLSQGAETDFRNYLSASSTPPVLGRLSGIAETTTGSEAQQFADGSLRHITPVGSYFAACQPLTLLAQNAPTTILGGPELGNCAARAHSLPEHEPIQQLFVIATSPYDRDSESRPVLDPKCCREGTRQIRDGRKILGRTLALLDDEVYRRDLDFLLSANDALVWRWQVYQQLIPRGIA